MEDEVLINEYDITSIEEYEPVVASDTFKPIVRKKNSTYLIFESYFLVLAFIFLITIQIIYFVKNRTNENKIRNLLIIMIIGIIVSVIIYCLGLILIPEY